MTRDTRSSTAAKPRLWVRRAVLATAAVVITLIVAEIGLRVLAYATNRERGIVFHAEYGWKMVPGVTKVGHLWGGSQPTQINQQGWRDTAFRVEASDAHQRIAVVGDSFTFGVGVNNGERFTEYLETMPAGLDVLNFGFNSSGTDQHLRVLEEEVLRYRPSVVVLVTFLGNDLLDIRYEKKRFWPKPYFKLQSGELRLVKPRQSFAVRVRTSSYLAEVLFEALGRVGTNNAIAPCWESADPIPLYLALVERMRRAVAKNGGHLLVVLVYGQERAAGNPLPIEKKVVDGFTASGMPMLDSLDSMARRASRESLYLPDGHWNPRGHAVFAELLYDRLTALGWLTR